jgi:hypothetical protein
MLAVLMDKWIIHKGYEGFADRLQSLSYCVDIAVKHNRRLYVDWTDECWVEGFYRYFSIDGFDNRLPEGKCYPEFWNGALAKPMGRWAYRVEDLVEFDLNKADGDVGVWVHPNIGFRAWNFGTLAKRLKINLSLELEKMLDVTPQKVVHLRGTDKGHDLDRFEMLLREHGDAALVSDDLRLVDRWKERYPNALILTDVLSEDGQPSHFVGVNGKTRHEVNLRVIADFMTLAFAHEAHALIEDSLFFKMARVYGGCYRDQMK